MAIRLSEARKLFEDIVRQECSYSAIFDQGDCLAGLRVSRVAGKRLQPDWRGVMVDMETSANLDVEKGIDDLKEQIHQVIREFSIRLAA